MVQLSRREEQVLLAVWNLKENAYLLAIKEYLTDLMEMKWSLGIVQKPLMQLEKKGFLESRMGGATQKRGGRRKKIYSINQRGVEALRSLKKEQDVLWEHFLEVESNAGEVT